MNIPTEYEELYNKVVDPQIFPQDQWFQLPKQKFILEFLEWYRKTTCNIEYHVTEPKFRVVSYPVSNLKNYLKVDILTPVSSGDIKPKVRTLDKGYSPVQANVPGKCHRMDLVEKILKDHWEKNRPSEEWEKRERLRKAREDFFGFG